MTAFIVIGAAGLAMVVLSLVLHDLLEGVFEALNVDVGGGAFSTPVVGSFLAAFGFGAALYLSASTAGAGAAAAVGLAAGLGFGAVALWMTRAFMNMATDEPVRLADLVGKTATVITRIPDGGFGEVAVSHLGQRLKLNARAARPVPATTDVVITEVTSSSSVLVEPESTFWGTAQGGN